MPYLGCQAVAETLAQYSRSAVVTSGADSQAEGLCDSMVSLLPFRPHFPMGKTVNWNSETPEIRKLSRICVLSQSVL